MAKRHRKRRSTLLIIRELQIRTPPAIMVIIREKKSNDKCWWGCREKETLIYCWWECELVWPLWKRVWRFLKKVKHRNTIWSSCSASGYLSKESKNHLKRWHAPLCSLQHLFTIAEVRRQPECHQWMDEQTEDVTYRLIHTCTHTVSTHTHSVIPLSHKRWDLDIGDNIGGPWGHYAMWSKSEKMSAAWFHSLVAYENELKKNNQTKPHTGTESTVVATRGWGQNGSRGSAVWWW